MEIETRLNPFDVAIKLGLAFGELFGVQARKGAERGVELRHHESVDTWWPTSLRQFKIFRRLPHRRLFLCISCFTVRYFVVI